MMSGFLSTYSVQIGLEFMYGKAIAYTSTSNRYVMLLTAAPASHNSPLSSLTELSAPGYARQAVTPSGWTTTVPTADFTQPTYESNAGTLVYGPFTATTGSGSAPATWAAVVDVLTGTSGHVYGFYLLDVPATAAQSETLAFAPNTLVMGLV
jgi:hypothetical protein